MIIKLILFLITINNIYNTFIIYNILYNNYIKERLYIFMPQTINKLSLLKKRNNEEFLENNKIVKNLSSFKEIKEFRKRNLKTDVLPSMTVKSNLIKKFREEAEKND
jgi:hypothetical protein